MANLTIGCDFRAQHLIAIKDLVCEQQAANTPHRIIGVYGNMRGAANPFRSVRPSRRERFGHQREFIDSIEFLKGLGLSVAITLNSTFPHLSTNLRKNIFDDEDSKLEFIKYISNMHEYVDYWIVSHPYVVELMHSKMLPEFNIVLSTIMNVNRLAQVNWISKNWPRVKRVCPAIDRNRDLKWLNRANQIIPLEILANEFCSIGGVSCEGLYRQACYASQSLDVEEWNPMKSCCIESRDRDQSSWISARVVLPQWLKHYENATLIKNYKISGRTHAAQFITYIGQVYTRGEATGSIRQLWGQLEATLKKCPNQKKAHHTAIDKAPSISIEEVAKYLSILIKCDLDECRLTCHKCEHIYEEIMGDE